VFEQTNQPNERTNEQTNKFDCQAGLSLIKLSQEPIIKQFMMKKPCPPPPPQKKTVQG